MNDAQRQARLRNWDLFQLCGMRQRLIRLCLKHNLVDLKAELVDLLNVLEDKIRVST
mgnify:CR=1 FL=1